jgi:TPR repeat protein
MLSFWVSNVDVVLRNEEVVIFRRIALALVIVLLVALPATAQDFKKGLAAAKRGDYATALLEWRPLAAKGHARAQYNLGFMYDEGRGVPLDPIHAAKWFRKAAEQGHAKAQRALGLKYEYGSGVPQNYVLAHMWYSLSAANRDKFATKYRNEITKRMTPTQVAKAQKLAQDWLQKHKKK